MKKNIFAMIAISYSMSVILYEKNIIVALVMFLTFSIVEYGVHSYVYYNKYDAVQLWIKVLFIIVGYIPLFLTVYLYNVNILSQTTSSIIIIFCLVLIFAFLGMLRAVKKLKK